MASYTVASADWYNFALNEEVRILPPSLTVCKQILLWLVYGGSMITVINNSLNAHIDMTELYDD